MRMKVLTVSNLNSYIKKTFDNDVILNNIHVKGEISNFKMHSSGHCYFAIKDKNGKINCVMFREYAEQLRFLPKEGDNVVIKGRISVYERDGTYQLYAREIELEGVGELYYEFNILKEKLYKEGLFDEATKKKIPNYPETIGVITSPTGAAIRDIINVCKRRNPKVKIIIFPALVQGSSAADTVIKGVETLNKINSIDTIIIARGGGSIEELWPFNNEKLAYAIYKSKKPIISAIGHEVDFTICDFVSDMRAPTPSAAAELAVPLYEEMIQRYVTIKDKLQDIISQWTREENLLLDNYKTILNNNSPKNFIVNQYKYIENLKNAMTYNMKLKLNENIKLLSNVKIRLDSNNPLQVVKNGYAIVEDKNDKIISNIKDLKACEYIYLTFKDGRVKVNISVEDVL